MTISCRDNSTAWPPTQGRIVWISRWWFKPFLHTLSPDTKTKNQHLLLFFPIMEGNYREQWASSFLSEQISSATPHKSSHLVFLPSLLPSFGHILIFLYSSHIVEPKNAHSTWGKAAPYQYQCQYRCWAWWDIHFFWLISCAVLNTPMAQLALLATRIHCWLTLSLAAIKIPSSLSSGLHFSLLSLKCI